jgi:signal-transduction protein with cAMP-binding, CBS, and nucleotidyltransferase domain
MSVVSMNVPEEVFLDIHKDKDEFTDYMKKLWHLICIKTRKFRWDIVPALQT